MSPVGYESLGLNESGGFGFLPETGLLIPVNLKGQLPDLIFRDTIQHGGVACDDLFLNGRREHEHVKDMVYPRLA